MVITIETLEIKKIRLPQRGTTTTVLITGFSLNYKVT